MMKKIILLLIISTLLIDSSFASFITTTVLTEEQKRSKEFTEAAFKGNLQKVQDMLKEGIDINTPFPSGQTALQRAAKEGHVEMVQLLLHEGANASSMDTSKTTPLIAAISAFIGKRIRLAEPIERDIKAKWKQEYQRDLTDEEKKAAEEQALAMATEPTIKAIEEIVRLLIAHKADIDAQDKNGQTALMLASVYRLKSIVQILLTAGADIGLRDATGKRAIDVAIEEKNSIREKIKTAADDKQRTALEKQLKSNELISELLLRSINEFIQAAATGNKEKVDAMISKGMKVDTEDLNRLTAVQAAAMNGHNDVVMLLLEKGAELEGKDVLGQKILQKAAGQGQVETVKLLLDEGANPAHIDNENNTALMTAIMSYPKYRKEHALAQMVEIFLFEKETDVNQQNRSGQTALILAATLSLVDIVQMLLDVGANTDVTDNLNKKAIDWTQNKTIQDMIKKTTKEMQAKKAEALKEAVPLIEEATRKELAERLRAEEAKRLEVLRKDEEETRRQEELRKQQEEAERRKQEEERRIQVELQRQQEEEARKQEEAERRKQEELRLQLEQNRLPTALHQLEQRLIHLQNALQGGPAGGRLIIEEPLVKIHQ